MKNIVLFYHHCSIEYTSWVGGGGDGGGSGGDVLNGFFCHIFLGKMQKEVVIR